MELLTGILKELGLRPDLCLAGFVGSLLNIGKGETINLKHILITLFIGVGSANYLSSFIAEYTAIGDYPMHGVGFLLGVAGRPGLELAQNKIFHKLKSQKNGTNP